MASFKILLRAREAKSPVKPVARGADKTRSVNPVVHKER